MDQTIKPLSNKRIAYIQANWHRDIVDQARQTFIKSCAGHGIDDARIETFEVPGSLEIPLQCKLLAKTGQYDIIVAPELKAVQWALNTRPRKTLGWRTPVEALEEHLRSSHTTRVATTS